MSQSIGANDSGTGIASKNETPKMTLGDKAPEWRLTGQILHAETKPYPRNAAVPRGFERASHVSFGRPD
jgi:hypothetical protein